MSEFVKNVYRERIDFAKIKSHFPIPDLLEVQKFSYERFLQTGIKAEEREEIGLKSVWKSVFPITDFKGTCSLEFVEYDIGNPKYTIEECKERGMTYAAPLKVTIRLLVWDKDEKTEEKTIRDVKEQEVYFGPWLTNHDFDAGIKLIVQRKFFTATVKAKHATQIGRSRVATKIYSAANLGRHIFKRFRKHFPKSSGVRQQDRKRVDGEVTPVLIIFQATILHQGLA